MALLFFDGFEYSSSGSVYTSKFWNNSGWSINSSNPRNGNYSVSGAGNPSLTFTSNPATIIMGVGYYNAATFPNNYFLRIYDGGTVQCSLFINGSGQLLFYLGQGAFLHATSTETLSLNSWHFIEIKVTIHNTAGAVIVNVNEVEFINKTSIDTQASANAYCNKLDFVSYDSSYLYDDFYLCDTTGSDNNDILGDCKVEGFIANAAGDSTQWTPSAGSNYQNVDDTQPDDDSTYNSDSVAAELDLYNIPAADITGQIFGVQLSNYMRKDDAGARTVKNAIKAGTTTAYGSNESMADSYNYYHTIWENNPDDSLAWQDADIDSLQIGAEIVS